MDTSLKIKHSHPGQPTKYQPKELSYHVNKYLDNEPVPTMYGLANYLKLPRSSLYYYEDMPQFSDIIKRARDRITGNIISKGLQNKYNNGMAIFWLKNNAINRHGSNWADKTEVTNTSIDNALDFMRDQAKLMHAQPAQVVEVTADGELVE